MVRVLPIRVVVFLLLVGTMALCQQRQEKVDSNALPDAPSWVQASWVQASAQNEQGSGAAARGGTPGAPTLLWDGDRAIRAGFGSMDREDANQKLATDFFERHLYPALLKRHLDYRPSISGNLMGRATYAASQIFVTRDESGKGRLNSSYFVGVLSSALVHLANRPYWNRSASAPFSDFGSTIGNDAGMNVLHEFRPGLEQLVKSHAPRFVTRVEQRIGRN